MSRLWGSLLVPHGHVTLRQASLEAGVSTRTVLAAIAAGDLPGARKIRTGRAGEAWVVPSEEVGGFAMRQAAGLTPTARRDAALERGRLKSIRTRQETAARELEVTDLARLGGQLLTVGGAPAVSAALQAAGFDPALPLREIPPGWRAAARTALNRELRHH